MIQRVMVTVIILAAVVYVMRCVFREWKLKNKGCSACALKLKAKGDVR